MDKLKEYIKQLTRKILDEESVSGDAGGYLTPRAFSKGSGENAATKAAKKQGFKVTKGETKMPADSKVKDYKSLWSNKKKKVKIYEAEIEFKVGDKVKYENQEWEVEKILDNGTIRLKHSKGLPSTNVLPNKVKKLEESNYDAKSTYGQSSKYTAASGYTGGGLKGDDYYKRENLDSSTVAKEYLGKEKYDSLFKAGRLAAEKGETENPFAKSPNVISRQAWDDGFNSVKKENMNESLINIVKEELLNEVTYHKFKNEVKFRTKNEQLHKAIREVKRKLMEIDRIVEYTSRMKQELSEGEEGLKYWKKTESNIATISEMVNHLNNKIKNLNQ